MNKCGIMVMITRIISKQMKVNNRIFEFEK